MVIIDCLAASYKKKEIARWKNYRLISPHEVFFKT